MRNITYKFGPPLNSADLSKEAREVWSLMITGKNDASTLSPEAKQMFGLTDAAQRSVVKGKGYHDRRIISKYKGKFYTWDKGCLIESDKCPDF